MLIGLIAGNCSSWLWLYTQTVLTWLMVVILVWCNIHIQSKIWCALGARFSFGRNWNIRFWLNFIIDSLPSRQQVFWQLMHDYLYINLINVKDLLTEFKNFWCKDSEKKLSLIVVIHLSTTPENVTAQPCEMNFSYLIVAIYFFLPKLDEFENRWLLCCTEPWISDNWSVSRAVKNSISCIDTPF